MSVSGWLHRLVVSAVIVLASSGSALYLRLKFSDELASGKTLEATQTLSGPVVGIGLYF